jgi:phage shock protein A
MGFFGRTLVGIRQGVKKLFLEETEPEIILEQTLWDLEKQLIQMRRAAAQAIACSKRVERQQQEVQGFVSLWQNRAQMAADYGDHSLATEAIARSQSYQTIATNLQTQAQTQQTFITGVRKNLRDLEDKVTQIKLQKELYLTRIRAALANQQIHHLKTELTEGAIQPAIADLEASLWQIEADNDLTDALEAKFIALEQRIQPHQ